jgi:CheY-like chemotaxis protein
MRLRVLIADPDEMLLAAYRAFLAGEGVEVRTVTNGLECLDALRHGRPDVLVLDPDLRWGSGLDVLALLGEDVPAAPVLILTSRPEQVAESAVPVRDYALLIKPVPPAVVAGVIGTLAESGWARRVGPRAAPGQPIRSSASGGAGRNGGNHAPEGPDVPARPARHLGGR